MNIIQKWSLYPLMLLCITFFRIVSSDISRETTCENPCNDTTNFPPPQALWHNTWELANQKIPPIPLNTFATARSDVPYFQNMIRITEKIPGTESQYIYWLFLLKQRNMFEDIPVRLETLLVGPQTYVHGPVLYFNRPDTDDTLPYFFGSIGRRSHHIPGCDGFFYDEAIECIYIGDDPEESAKNNATDYTYIRLRDMVKQLLKRAECNGEEEVRN